MTTRMIGNGKDPVNKRSMPIASGVRRSVLFGLIAVVGAGMNTNGCPTDVDFTPLAGVWSLTRGAVTVKFTFTVNNGGEVTQNTQTTDLEPLDPVDFPPELAELVNQWNAGLTEINARLDAAMPDSVQVSFPSAGVMRLTDPADAMNTADGLIDGQDRYVFLDDLAGDGQGSDQGGGAILTSSSVEGSFDRTNLTTSGNIIRRLAVVLIGGNNNALSFVVEISAAYTGTRTGDLPM